MKSFYFILIILFVNCFAIKVPRQQGNVSLSLEYFGSCKDFADDFNTVWISSWTNGSCLPIKVDGTQQDLNDLKFSHFCVKINEKKSIINFLVDATSFAFSFIPSKAFRSVLNTQNYIRRPNCNVMTKYLTNISSVVECKDNPVEIDPSSFVVSDDRIYIFPNATTVSTCFNGAICCPYISLVSQNGSCPYTAPTGKLKLISLAKLTEQTSAYGTEESEYQTNPYVNKNKGHISHNSYDENQNTKTNYNAPFIQINNNLNLNYNKKKEEIAQEIIPSVIQIEKPSPKQNIVEINPNELPPKIKESISSDITKPESIKEEKKLGKTIVDVDTNESVETKEQSKEESKQQEDKKESIEIIEAKAKESKEKETKKESNDLEKKFFQKFTGSHHLSGNSHHIGANPPKIHPISPQIQHNPITNSNPKVNQQNKEKPVSNNPISKPKVENKKPSNKNENLINPSLNNDKFHVPNSNNNNKPNNKNEDIKKPIVDNKNNNHASNTNNLKNNNNPTHKSNSIGPNQVNHKNLNNNNNNLNKPSLNNQFHNDKPLNNNNQHHSENKNEINHKINHVNFDDSPFQDDENEIPSHRFENVYEDEPESHNPHPKPHNTPKPQINQDHKHPSYHQQNNDDIPARFEDAYEDEPLPSHPNQHNPNYGDKNADKDEILSNGFLGFENVYEDEPKPHKPNHHYGDEDDEYDHKHKHTRTHPPTTHRYTHHKYSTRIPSTTPPSTTPPSTTPPSTTPPSTTPPSTTPPSTMYPHHTFHPYYDDDNDHDDDRDDHYGKKHGHHNHKPHFTHKPTLPSNHETYSDDNDDDDVFPPLFPDHPPSKPPSYYNKPDDDVHDIPDDSIFSLEKRNKQDLQKIPKLD